MCSLGFWGGVAYADGGVSSCGPTQPGLPRLVAHAGGAVQSLTYTNSLEALQANYKKGHRYFELDFSWTADGKIAVVHDWTRHFEHLFQESLGFWGFLKNGWIEVYWRYWLGKNRPTYESYRKLSMRHGLTQLTVPDLREWLAEHEDAFVVTDFKGQNVRGLQRLSEQLGTRSDQVIPQIYSVDEMEPVQSLGFKDIILTVYRMNLSDSELLKRTLPHKMWAVTMPVKRAMESSLARELARRKVPVYVHVVNDANHLKSLCARGVYGVYTDSLDENLSAESRYLRSRDQGDLQ